MTAHRALAVARELPDPCGRRQLVAIEVVERDGSRPLWLGACPCCSRWRLPVRELPWRNDDRDRRRP